MGQQTAIVVGAGIVALAHPDYILNNLIDLHFVLEIFG